VRQTSPPNKRDVGIGPSAKLHSRLKAVAIPRLEHWHASRFENSIPACAKGASPQLKWHPQEREHSDGAAGTRDRVQRRDRLRAVPADGAVIAIAEGKPLPRVPPARRSLFLARGIAAARPRRRAARFTRARCGASRTRTNKNPPKEEAQGTRISSQAFVSAS
jgi:hypothetical protein